MGQGWDNVSLQGHWPGCCHLGSPTTYYLCTPGKSLAPQEVVSPFVTGG